jgi:putative tricarboxylic transport membrane protein
MGNVVKFHAESILNLILTVLGLVITIMSVQIGFGTLRAPGSGLFTFLAGLLIFFPNLILLFRRRSEKSDIVLDRDGMIKFVVISVTLALWIVLMPLLGYILMTFVATFVLARTMKLEGWLKPLLLSIGTTALCFVLFDYVLYLDLPRGFLG